MLLLIRRLPGLATAKRNEGHHVVRVGEAYTCLQSGLLSSNQAPVVPSGEPAWKSSGLAMWRALGGRVPCSRPRNKTEPASSHVHRNSHRIVYHPRTAPAEPQASHTALDCQSLPAGWAASRAWTWSNQRMMQYTGVRGAAARRAVVHAPRLRPLARYVRRGPARPGALHHQAAGVIMRPVKGAVSLVRRIPRPRLPRLREPATEQASGAAPVPPQHAPAAYVVQDSFDLRPQQVPLALEPPTTLMAAAAGPPPAMPLPVAMPAPPVAPPFAAAPFAAASPHLAFARHLAAACNGAAPLQARMEAASLLLFNTGRQQRALLAGPPSDAASWLASPDSVTLLEQVYEVGGALADLGVGDAGPSGPYAGAAPVSNGARAVAALDFAALLTRYLQQHGVTLRDAFVAELPYDWLQVRARAGAALLGAARQWSTCQRHARVNAESPHACVCVSCPSALRQTFAHSLLLCHASRRSPSCLLFPSPRPSWSRRGSRRAARCTVSCLSASSTASGLRAPCCPPGPRRLPRPPSSTQPRTAAPRLHNQPQAPSLQPTRRRQRWLPSRVAGRCRHLCLHLASSPAALCAWWWAWWSASAASWHA
jgi:hypothetical protein